MKHQNNNAIIMDIVINSLFCGNVNVRRIKNKLAIAVQNNYNFKVLGY